MTSAEPVVTLIGFGMAKVSGSTMAVPCAWEEGMHYAPEMCKNETLGRCSSQSDVFSLGQIICQLFEGPKMPSAVRKWFFRSQSQSPEARQGIAALTGCLEAEKGKLEGERRGG